MPIDTDIDENRRCVVITISGDVTFPQLAEAISSSVRDPRFRPGFSIFSDHRKITQPISDAQTEQVIQFLEEIADVISGARWAMVSPRPESAEMRGRVSALARRVQLDMRAFASVEEAESWLFADG